MAGQSNTPHIKFSNYRLDHLIGSGSFARVYKGWDVDANKPVAIKILDANFPGSDIDHADDFFGADQYPNFLES